MQDGNHTLAKKGESNQDQSIQKGKPLERPKGVHDKVIQNVTNEMEDTAKEHISSLMEQITMPGRKMNEALSSFGKGEVAQGVGNLLESGVSLLGAVIAPIQAGSESITNLLPENIKNLGMSKGTADEVNKVITQPFSSGAEQIDALAQLLPNYIPLQHNNQTIMVTKDEMMNLGVSKDVVDALNPALRQVGDLASQALLAKKLELSRTQEVKSLYEPQKLKNPSIELPDEPISKEGISKVGESEKTLSKASNGVVYNAKRGKGISADEQTTSISSQNVINEQKYNNFLSKIARKMDDEARGQYILDTLEEKGITPNQVAKDFWEKTYPKLDETQQRKFEKMLLENYGVELAKTKEGIAKQGIEFADYGNDITMLEGTERGDIALMSYANDMIKNPKTSVEKIVPLSKQELEASFKKGESNYDILYKMGVKSEDMADKILPSLREMRSEWNKSKTQPQYNTSYSISPEQIDQAVLVDKSQMTPKEAKNVQVQQHYLKKQIDQFLTDPVVKKRLGKDANAVANDIIRTISKFEDIVGKKYASTNLTNVRNIFLDRGTMLTKYHGAPGGKLYNLGMESVKYYETLLQRGHELLNPLKDLEKEAGGYLHFNEDIFPKVVDALQNRAKATDILGDNALAKKTYNIVQRFYDYFGEELKRNGYTTVENYFTRQAKSSIISDMLDQSKDMTKMTTARIEEFFNTNSKYLKERTKEINENIRKKPFVLYTYLNSITRELAFKKLRDYAGNDFIKEVKANPLLQQDMSYVRKYLSNLITPERAYSKGWRTVEKVRGNIYTAFLWNNPKLAIQNALQKNVAKMFVDPLVEKYANKIFHDKIQPTGNLLDAITEAHNKTSAYMGEGTPEVYLKGKVRQWMEEHDLFHMTEEGNWQWSEVAGIMNHLVRKYKATTFDAMNKLLDDKKIFNDAVNEGRDLAARTQVSPSSAFRPQWYDQPFTRVLSMFTRYPLQMSDLFVKTVFKNLEGIDGMRAQNILRRGYSGDVEPVEMLRSLTHVRKTMEFALKESNKQKYDLGVSKQVIHSYIDLFKKREKEINGMIKEIEPMKRSRNVKSWTKYIGLSITVSMAYRLLQNELQDSIGLNKTRRKRTIGDHLINSLLDSSPFPLVRTSSGKMFAPPIFPGVDVLLYGNFNTKGLTQGFTDWGLRFTPGANILNQAFNRVTGLSAGKVLSNQISGSNDRRRRRRTR